MSLTSSKTKIFNRYKTLRPYLLLIAGLPVLQACVSSTSLPFSRANDSWQFNGKIGVVYPAGNCNGNDCPLQSEQGNLQWQQQKTQYHVSIADPFNRVLMQIDGDPQTLTLKQPKQPAQTASPADFLQLLLTQNRQSSLLANITPVDLRYWLTGRQNPAENTAEKQDKSFQQKGFTIRSTQWRDTAVGKMPSLINISKGRFRLRIVVREWLAIN